MLQVYSNIQYDKWISILRLKRLNLKVLLNSLSVIVTAKGNLNVFFFIFFS